MIPYLRDLGLCNQTTNDKEISDILTKQKISFYFGLDCTAHSLHIGNLALIMLARKMQRAGHKPIILIGGGTTKVGDPSGKITQRKLLDSSVIQENILGIKRSLSKFIEFDNKKNSAILENNDNWLSEINYLDFLRKYGSVISVNKLLGLEIFKSRINAENNLSFLEFNYPLLQAYDFLHLHNQHNCILQIGGSDQWGNIITGVQLTKKILHKELFGLTIPLITRSDGKKMGKSEQGAIWLNEDNTSPYEYFQYWRNISDDDICKFVNIFAEYNQDEISFLQSVAEKDINKAKEIFATRVTELCHGSESAKKALSSSIAVFSGTNKDLLFLPSFNVKRQSLNDGIKLQYLLNVSGASSSISEAKRLIFSNCCKLNDRMINNPAYLIQQSDFKDGTIIISIGKKKKYVISLIN